jgi:hypothetical protein
MCHHSTQGKFGQGDLEGRIKLAEIGHGEMRFVWEIEVNYFNQLSILRLKLQSVII